MKSFIGLIAVMSMCACAGRQGTVEAETPTNQFVFADELQPPTRSADIDLRVGKRNVPQHPVVVEDEQQTYHRSLANIDQTMLTEVNDYSQCLDLERAVVKAQRVPAVYCSRVLARMCAVDQMIDSRGGIHKKPYCLPAWNMRLK